MLNFQLDTNGSLNVIWPRTDLDVIALGERYVTFESQQPEAQRMALPNLDIVQALVLECRDAATAAQSAEASRATAANLWQQRYELAQSKGRLAIDVLKGLHASNLAELEHWGVSTKIAQNGKVSVRKPGSIQEWQTFYDLYLKQEASLEAGARVQQPSLEEMQALAADINSSYEARNQSRSSRESNVAVRKSGTGPLLNQLQLAAAALVLTRFDGRVDRQLQDWGYTLVSRKSSPPPDPAPIEITP